MKLTKALGMDTLEGKLVAAFAAMAIGALVIAGAVFVAVSRGKERQHQLDHIVANAPDIQNGFFHMLVSGATQDELASYTREAANAYAVRVVMFDYSGLVVEDTGGKLAGQTLSADALPSNGPDQPQNWVVAAGSDRVSLVAPFPAMVVSGQAVPTGFSAPRGGFEVRGRQAAEIEPYSLALVVPESTVARAWLGLLPALLIASGVAIPISALMAVFVARHITRPLRELTEASHQMAGGDFDVKVATGRQDEVGELSQAFSAMAERVGSAHRQMSTLLANISHDVRTPLTSILGFAQALRTGVVEGESETRRVGEVIYEEADRLSRRLNDSILLSELESGQAVLQKEPVDLSEMLRESKEAMSARARSRGLDVVSDMQDGVVVEGDRVKLERALDNLLDNALKYAPDGGLVRMQGWSDDGCAFVRIANGAPGMDPEELPHLFERFYRSARTGSSQQSGSGLGLPIARDLIEMHGGSVSAALQDGEISFLVQLPR